MNKPRTSLSLLDLHLLVSRSPNVAMLLGVMALSIFGLMAVTRTCCSALNWMQPKLNWSSRLA